MKKHWIMLVAAAGFAFSACDRATTTDTETTTTTETTVTDTVAAQASDTNTMGGATSSVDYNSRADQLVTTMDTDLNLDTAQERRVRSTYLTRTQRYSDLESRYGKDTTGWATERRTMNQQYDAEMKNILRPDQYKRYETDVRSSQSKFRDEPTFMQGIDHTQVNEAKMKTGDTKMKMEGDEAKYKSGDTKMKSDASEGESKTVTGDTKMKSEPGKTKYESGDTKVKTEGGDYKAKDGDTKVKIKQ